MAIVTIVLDTADENISDVIAKLQTHPLVVSSPAAVIEQPVKITETPSLKEVVTESEDAALAESSKAATTDTTEEMPSDLQAFLKEPEENEIEVDKNGLPWDERIHSGNHKKTTKNIWQRRKGIDDTYFKEISDELTANMTGAPAPEPTTDAPSPPGPAGPAPTTPAAPVVSDWTWPQILTAVTQGTQNKTLLPAKVNEALTAVGISELALLSTQADKFAEFAAHCGFVK